MPICSIHNKEVPQEYMERHHLFPKKRRGQKAGRGPTILVCAACGNQLHLLFTNKELRTEYNTLAKLLANEKVQKWVTWISNRRDLSVCSKTKKKT